jgi:tRNA threonylcarbamoyladenosine biosynthesis protein TsaE
MDVTFTEAQIQEVARQLTDAVPGKVLAFYGAMGAGKTTLIKALLRELGAKDSGSSPSFGIVNEYHDKAGQVLAYHFDFYRLEEETEALDLGFEDYLAQDAWIFMEWPEKIAGLLPEEAACIRLEVVDAGTRSLQIV